MENSPHRKTRETFNTPGEPHELTFTCFKFRKFLSKDRTRQYVIDALARFPGEYDFDLWAYVIMPEHMHVIVAPRHDEYDMSDFLKSFKQSVSRKAINYLRRYKPDGLRLLATGMKDSPYAFWMDGPGYDRNVIKLKTLNKMVDYVHDNPVRRGLVKSPEDWAWSSAREWLEPGSGPVPLDLDSFPY
jgi:putative transposase